MGVEVIRPDVSGLMGAYGMALLASEAAEELQNQHSTLLDYGRFEILTSFLHLCATVDYVLIIVCSPSMHSPMVVPM